MEEYGLTFIDTIFRNIENVQTRKDGAYSCETPNAIFRTDLVLDFRLSISFLMLMALEQNH